MRRMRCRTILEELGTKINRIRRSLPANTDFTAHLLSHPLVPRVCQLPLKGKPLTIVAPSKLTDKLQFTDLFKTQKRTAVAVLFIYTIAVFGSAFVYNSSVRH